MLSEKRILAVQLVLATFTLLNCATSQQGQEFSNQETAQGQQGQEVTDDDGQAAEGNAQGEGGNDDFNDDSNQFLIENGGDAAAVNNDSSNEFLPVEDPAMAADAVAAEETMTDPAADAAMANPVADATGAGDMGQPMPMPMPTDPAAAPLEQPAGPLPVQTQYESVASLPKCGI